MSTCPCCETYLDETWLREQVNLTLPPVGRDEFDKNYLSFEYLDELDKLRGINRNLQRHMNKNLQRFVWVIHPRSRELVLVRYKDIRAVAYDFVGRKRKLMPELPFLLAGLKPQTISLHKKANTPLRLPYLPTEVCDLHGNRIATLKEGYVSHRTGFGPKVAPFEPKVLSLDAPLPKPHPGDDEYIPDPFTDWETLTDPELGDRRLHELTPLKALELKEAIKTSPQGPRYRLLSFHLALNIQAAEQPYLTRQKRLPRTKSQDYQLLVLGRMKGRRCPQPDLILPHRRTPKKRHIFSLAI